MHIPLTVLRLLPLSLIEYYLDTLDDRAFALSEKIQSAKQLLDDVDARYEYTKGFHTHVERKLDEHTKERKSLLASIAEIEEALFSTNDDRA